MSAAVREKLMGERRKTVYYGASRITVLRGSNGVAQISLRDALGRPRIVMRVANDGASSLKFPDADGKVQNELTPAVNKP